MQKTCVSIAIFIVVFAADCGFRVERQSDAQVSTTANDRETAKRPRVVITTDFPPIGVVKEGDVAHDQKSDPDDMQSMVRYLLYAK